MTLLQNVNLYSVAGFKNPIFHNRFSLDTLNYRMTVYCFFLQTFLLYNEGMNVSKLGFPFNRRDHVEKRSIAFAICGSCSHTEVTAKLSSH